MKLTKITTTIGPSAEVPEMIEKLYNSGTNMFRLNMSHDAIEVQGKKLGLIRDISKKLGMPIAVMADAQGPKHRIGDFKDGQLSGINKKYTLTPGQKYTLDSDPTPGDETRVCLPDKDVMTALKVGDRVLLNDGKIELKITKKNGNESIETEVIRGDLIWDRRGFNLPDTEIDTSILTAKDRGDLEYILPLEPDYVAISFVQKAEDVIEAREWINARTTKPIKIVSKLERPQVVGDRLEAIIDASDVIMVARGDLAVEMPFEQVPAAQRKMIRMCRAKNKPVIVATQMLGSMEKGLFPTRAEVSDIATSAYLLADSTMTSEETSMGHYPAETTAAMAKTLRFAEEDMYENDLDESDGEIVSGENAKFAAIIDMAEEAAEVIAIVSLDNTGDQTRKLSCRKTYLPIVSVSDTDIIANQLCLCRSVFPVVGTDLKDALKRTDVLNAGDRVLVVSNHGTKVELLKI